MEDLGYECSVFDLVEERAHKAVRAGMDGIVCSPREASMVRNAVGRDIIIVTPGVRSAAQVGGRPEARSCPGRSHPRRAPLTW